MVDNEVQLKDFKKIFFLNLQRNSNLSKSVTLDSRFIIEIPDLGFLVFIGGH